MFNVRILGLFCCIITILGCSGLSKTTKKTPIPMENQVVKISTTYGDMIVELYDETPKHKANFLKLVDSGFYDSLLFHRVINNFMIQGGDPDSRGADANAQLGSGGPGYQIDAEFNTKFYHKKGALSAARQGDVVNPQKKSSGSQFYIVQGKKTSPAELKRYQKPGFSYTEEQINVYDSIGGTPFLDQEYTVFGEVIYGLDVIDKIATVPTRRGDRPAEDIIMTMEIIDKTKAEELKK